MLTTVCVLFCVFFCCKYKCRKGSSELPFIRTRCTGDGLTLTPQCLYSRCVYRDHLYTMRYVCNSCLHILCNSGWRGGVTFDAFTIGHNDACTPQISLPPLTRPSSTTLIILFYFIKIQRFWCYLNSLLRIRVCGCCFLFARFFFCFKY